MILDKGYSIEVAGERCLNRLHRAIQCTHCESHCPATALVVQEDQVVLDASKCNGCGLCLSECPTQVFTSRRLDETSLLYDVEREGWRTTAVFCGRHTAPFQREEGRARGAVKLPACLAMLSAGAWYELGLLTAVEVHLDQCEGCPAERNLARVEGHLARAAGWLAAAGHEPGFRVVRENCESGGTRTAAAKETGLKVASRRELFLSLFARGRARNAGSRGERDGAERESGHVGRNGCVPEWRRRLAKIFPRSASPGAPAAEWPAITVSDQCTCCGLCGRHCPSGALEAAVEDGSFVLRLTSGLCLECRACEIGCPREAIRCVTERVRAPFEALRVYGAPIVACQRCESPTPAAGGVLCWWCSEERGIDEQFRAACEDLLLGAPAPRGSRE